MILALDSMSNSSVEENMRLMKTLDDAWNSQDQDTFNVRHADDVIVRWSGQPPTNGINVHKNVLFKSRLVDGILEAYRSLYEAFLGGASFANILMSSGVGSVSLSNLALTNPLGTATYNELPS
jgi:hypothetical protein